MSVDFSSVQNHYERAVFERILESRWDYPLISDEALPDVACLALNKLPVRYVRYPVDLCFYMTNKDRGDMNQAVHEAVHDALRFMSERLAKA
jgi:hypothetical protein